LSAPKRWHFCLLAIAAALVVVPAQADPGPPRVIVEFSLKAERTLDTRLTRRLVEIELSDAEVPPRPGTVNGERRPTVYFRVLVTAPQTLRIELWDHGEYYGARKLSAQDVPDLVARRVALAAAALVRDMAQRRTVEQANLEREQVRQELMQTELDEARRWPVVDLGARATGALVGPGDMFLVGPGLSGEVRLRSKTRLELGGAWLFGGVPAASGSASASWLEVALTPVQAFSLGSAVELGLGVTVAAAAVHFGRLSAVDDSPGEQDTWSARVAFRPTLEFALGHPARLAIGPELGAVLRRMPVVDESGDRHRLGGVWLGLSLAVALDPKARF
jgi:hypothetical protein